MQPARRRLLELVIAVVTLQATSSINQSINKTHQLRLVERRLPFIVIVAIAELDVEKRASLQ